MREGHGGSLFGLCLALSLSLLPPCLSARNVTVLNGGWHSVLTREGATSVTAQWDGNIPHNWDDYYGYRQQKHGNLHGEALYTRSFSANVGKGKCYFLQFEGIGSYATVILNGDTLCRKEPAGRTVLTVDVTKVIKQGDNSLAVLCSHPSLIANMPWVCGGCSSEWGFSEGSQPLGIFRPVSLIETDEVRIEPFGVHVWNNPKCDSVFLETEVKNYSSKTQTVTINNAISQADGKSVITLTSKTKLKAGETRIIRQSASISNVQLWSPATPYLYNIKSSLLRGKVVADESTETFGIRDISWPVLRKDGDNRFFVNGKPFFINGTCEYEHLLGAGHSFSHEQIKARIKMIRQAGFNAYREAHQPHNLLYQQLLDEQGILFWSQFSAHIWYDTPQFRDNFKRLLRQWVKERRNSPSVILWGLQNESTLPKAFAEECCEIIRELDPTCATMRAITTCNGGEGSDWNVIQNWSGTYGGTALNYDKELCQSNQLLNGEYGAWRTLGLHSSSPLDSLRKEKAYSEERATDILETKVRLAEEVKDSVCGHFQWIFTTHDNPGRVQPDESYRMIDKIGPVNYKGLMTPWEQPADAYFMYRSNYVSAETEPMVYIVSHTWADRFVNDKRRTDITVYSNCDSVVLYNSVDESVKLGRKKNAHHIGTHMLWEKRQVKYNVLRAVGYYGGKAKAEDIIILDSLDQAPAFDLLYANDCKDILKPVSGKHYVLRLNCGGDTFTDTFGNTWQADNYAVSQSWGKEQGMNPAAASQTTIPSPIRGTRNWQLFQSQRYGRHKLVYDIPVADGTYDVELYFAEPWHGVGSAGKSDFSCERMFSVAVNGKIVLSDIDLWQEAGFAGAVRKVVKAEAVNGHIIISFPEVKVGQAVIAGIAVSSSEDKPVVTFDAIDENAKVEWGKLTSQVIDKLPKEYLPADEEAFPATRYTEIGKASWQITPGVAREYALRFRYKNTADPIRSRLRVTDAKGAVLVDNAMTFPTTPKKFKIISTTTGTQINAGVYCLQLLNEEGTAPLEGVEFEYVEVQ